MDTNIVSPVRRLEIIAAALAVLVIAVALIWNEHNSRIKDQALAEERVKQTEAAQVQAQQQIAVFQKQIDAQQKIIETQTAQNQQLLAALGDLNNKFNNLRADESRQVQAVQGMSSADLAKALATVLPNVKYDPSTGIATGITTENLKTIETQKLQLDACVTQRTTLEDESAKYKVLSDSDASVISAQKVEIGNLNSKIDTMNIADQNEIKALKAQVKTVKGNLVHRLWNRVKFPMGVATGILITHGLGL